MSEQAVIRTAAVESRIRQLERERAALLAEVERLRQREQKRRDRVERKRASKLERELQGTPRLEPPRIDFERPDVPQRPLASELHERTGRLTDPAELYLDLLKNCLTRLVFGEAAPIDPLTFRPMAFDSLRRIEGSDWPSEAETMAGLMRLDNVQQCVVDVLRNGIPGDLVETGVWRGGITILMRAILKVYGDTERTVWAADSFAGLPVPDAEKYAVDVKHNMSTEAGFDLLAIPVEEVQANFVRYGLLDDRVRFLAGWFRDTLPTAPIERIAVLRLDGDLYESTIDALTALYPKLSVGGYLIIDDYLSWEPCRKAITDYQLAHGITEPIQGIDWTGAYWQRER